MTSLSALEQQLLQHLRHHLPAVQGQVYLAPYPADGAQQPCPAAARRASGSVWLYGPNWRRNPWASCTPGRWQRCATHFTRYHAPTAWDLCYDVLLMDRCMRSLNSVSAQLCLCIAQACNLVIPNQPPNTQVDPHSYSATDSYELAWDQAALSSDRVGTSGWYTASGCLKIEGVLLANDRIAQTGSVASKPVQLAQPRAKTTAAGG